MTITERLSQPARLRSLRLGGTTVTYLPDGVVQLSPRGWLPESSDADWAAHPEYLDPTGNLAGSIGGLLVEREGRAFLIDAGFGPESLPGSGDGPIGAVAGGALLESLAAYGRDPATIEAVAFTHLHTDHLGWARHRVPGSDRFAFPDAHYLVATTEWEHRDPDIVAALVPRVRTVDDGAEVFPEVRAWVTGGHTAGHTTYVIEADGQRLIAFGDALHSPLQVAHPEWSAVNDHNRELGVAHRRRLVAEMAQPGTIGFGVHFADVVFGRVDGTEWVPVAS